MLRFVAVLVCWAVPGLGADIQNAGGSVQQRPGTSATSGAVQPAPVGRGRLPLPDEITLPRLDIDSMRTQHESNWLGPTRPFPAQVDGTWAVTQDGRRVWRVIIRVIGARALRVRFEDFNAEGAVWLYGDEWTGPQIGPYTAAGPHSDGSFWSEFVFAGIVTVEYVPDDPAAASQRIPFRIDSVAQIVDSKFPVPGAWSKVGEAQPRAIAGCHLDASCYPDLQTRDRPSVAMLYISRAEGNSTCTGFLINPREDGDDRLLLLTAGHCIRTREEARDASFLWNYQTRQCYGNPDWSLWAEKLQYTYGSTLLVSKEDRYDDFALLALRSEDVLEVTGVRKLGWTTTAVRTGDQVSSVGHPDGSLKRAAFGRVVDNRWRDASPLGFQTIQWRLGTSEPGSSGSPVFKGGNEGQVVGILTGGNHNALNDGTPWGPFCDAGLRASFNRFDHIYQTIKPYLADEGESTEVNTRAGQIVVSLGSSGESVTLLRDEDGSYRMGGVIVVSGKTAVRATNRNIYTLTLKPTTAGTIEWMAVYSAEEVRVRLGNSGYTVTLVKSEDLTWRRGQTIVRVDSVVTAPDGTRYRLLLVAGRWVAREVTG